MGETLIVHAARNGESGIVHQNVDTAKMGCGIPHRLLDRIPIRHIHLQWQNLSPHGTAFFGDAGQGIAINVKDGEPGTLIGEQMCCSAPHPAGGSGDNGNAATDGATEFG